jgi:hypothetical protein
MGMLSSLCFPTSWFQEHNRSGREECEKHGEVDGGWGERGMGRSGQVA